MTVRLMSLTEILQTVEGSCDFEDVADYEGDTLDEQRTSFWNEIIANKASDSGFGHLVESILEKGFDPEGAIGWYDNRITEGHHRLVACILLAHDEVYVDNYGGDPVHTHPDYPDRNRFSAHRCSSDPYPIEIE